MTLRKTIIFIGLLNLPIASFGSLRAQSSSFESLFPKAGIALLGVAAHYGISYLSRSYQSSGNIVPQTEKQIDEAAQTLPEPHAAHTSPDLQAKIKKTLGEYASKNQEINASMHAHSSESRIPLVLAIGGVTCIAGWNLNEKSKTAGLIGLGSLGLTSVANMIYKSFQIQKKKSALTAWFEHEKQALIGQDSLEKAAYCKKLEEEENKLKQQKIDEERKIEEELKREQELKRQANQKMFEDALRNNDLIQAKECVRLGADVNGGCYLTPPLQYAMNPGRNEAFHYLSHHPQTRISPTALIDACNNNQIDIFKKFLAAPGINVNGINNEGETALIVATRTRKHEYVHALLKQEKINLDAQDQAYTQVLNAFVPTMQKLQETLSDLYRIQRHLENELDKVRYSMYSINLTARYTQESIDAVREQHSQITDRIEQVSQIINSNRGLVNQLAGAGRTALWYAVAENDLALVQLLLAAGANPNLSSFHTGTEQRFQALTPLELALIKQNNLIAFELVKNEGTIVTEEIAEMILPPAYKSFPRFNKPLLESIAKKNLEGVNKALKEGCDVNTRDILPADIDLKHSKEYQGPDETIMMGLCALDKAIISGDSSIVQRLLQENSVDIASASFNGHSPLMVAAYAGNPAIAQLILDRPEYTNPFLSLLLGNAQSPVNAKNKIGNTALHIAAYKGHLPIVQQLLVKGANPAIKNKGGFTFLDMARIKGHKEILERFAHLDDSNDLQPPTLSEKDAEKLHKLEFSVQEITEIKNLPRVRRAIFLALAHDNAKLAQALIQSQPQSERKSLASLILRVTKIIENKKQRLKKQHKESYEDLPPLMDQEEYEKTHH